MNEQNESAPVINEESASAEVAYSAMEVEMTGEFVCCDLAQGFGDMKMKTLTL